MGKDAQLGFGNHTWTTYFKTSTFCKGILCDSVLKTEQKPTPTLIKKIITKKSRIIQLLKTLQTNSISVWLHHLFFQGDIRVRLQQQIQQRLTNLKFVFMFTGSAILTYAGTESWHCIPHRLQCAVTGLLPLEFTSGHGDVCTLTLE